MPGKRGLLLLRCDYYLACGAAVWFRSSDDVTVSDTEFGVDRSLVKSGLRRKDVRPLRRQQSGRNRSASQFCPANVSGMFTERPLRPSSMPVAQTLEMSPTHPRAPRSTLHHGNSR